MNDCVFKKTFPVLYDLLAGSNFSSDIERAESMSEGELREALESENFKLPSLMLLLSGAVISEWADFGGLELEGNLAIVEEFCGPQKMKGAFRQKLLNPSEDVLEDTRYEVAVTARACKALDEGSIRLEHPIKDEGKLARDYKNSDIFGTFRGAPVRIEVTTLHEKPPLSVDLSLTEGLEEIPVSGGFRITMRKPLQNRNDLEEAKALLVSLHDHHCNTGGASVQIDGLCFAYDSVYRCERGPFEWVEFLDADDPCGRGGVREISHGVSVRRVTPAYLAEDYPHPRGVVDALDVIEASYPLSTKIRNILAGKLSQCESGIINIIAFGNPNRRDERDLIDALFGVVVPEVTIHEDEKGVYRLGETKISRAPKAPFNSPSGLSSDDVETFIEPFRILSAVWHVRLGRDPLSKVILNPNAFVSASEELCRALIKASQ